MLRFLRRLIRSEHPLDDGNLGDHVRDMDFRTMEDADIPTCLSFYRANESAHFPPGRFDHYEMKLRDRQFLNLLAMRNGRPVGCCGIHYSTSTEGHPIGVFCFGMVDPAHQKQGIGTAQVLVRLGLLTVTNDLAVAAMLAVPNAVSFYRRFGFKFDQEVQGDDGGVYKLGLLEVAQSFIDDCRAVLLRRHIICPDVRTKFRIDTLPECA